MALNGFSILLFVPTEPEIFAEISELPTLRFTPSFSDWNFHTVPLKIRFIMTWVSHYIMFQKRKESKFTGQKS